MGLTLTEYLSMDHYEFCCWVKGYNIRVLDERKWQRYWTAILLQPNSKKAIDPKALIEFPDEKTGVVIKKDQKKWEEMQRIHAEWDKESKNE